MKIGENLTKFYTWSKGENCAIKIKKVNQALVIPLVMFEVTLQQFFFKLERH